MSSTPPEIPELFTVPSAELRSTVSSRTPIRFSIENEPYLPIPEPFSNFRLTTPRQSDVLEISALFSDVHIARTLVGPAFPYLPIHAQRWLNRERAAAERLFSAYAEGHFLPAEMNVCSALREVQPDGKEVFVGEISLYYCGDEAKRVTPVNESWEEWRTRTKVWEIGAAIKSSYQGKGLTSAAIHVLKNDWAIAQMGATELRAQCFVSNTPSVKLWQKHGFVEMRELVPRGTVHVEEAKGSGVEEDFTLIWHLN